MKAADCRPVRYQPWQPTTLGKDEGTYGFRQWQTTVSLLTRGAHTVMSRCTNTDQVMQPMQRVWNPGGYLANQVESVDLVAA